MKSIDTNSLSKQSHVVIRKILHGSDDYKAELDLRNRVLRIPLGLDIHEDNISREHLDTHIGAFIEERLAGVLVLTPLNESEVKMRQVAVEQELQGKGIGKLLVDYSEKQARLMGFSKIVMNARLEAVPFYEKLGYTKAGDLFIEVTIPHYKLEKII